MRVTRLPDVQPRPRRVAVGMFDGVHRGHRAVIAGADTVLTFDPHPTTVISPEHTPKLLTTPARKAELLASIGVEEMVLIPFDREFAGRSAQSFIDDVLVGSLTATHVSVGENFRFGRRAEGLPTLLEQDTRFETRVVQLLEVDAEIVSSSHIRGLIAGGAMEYAVELLGAPLVIEGSVTHGEKRGRTLGYPTANLVPEEGYLTPAYGVYATRAWIDGASYAAATSIGIRPQFATGLGELIEAFVLDFDGDLYGRTLRLEFHKRLRGEKRFDSVEALLEQMGRDVQNTRRLLPSPPA